MKSNRKLKTLLDQFDFGMNNGPLTLSKTHNDGVSSLRPHEHPHLFFDPFLPTFSLQKQPNINPSIQIQSSHPKQSKPSNKGNVLKTRKLNPSNEAVHASNNSGITHSSSCDLSLNPTDKFICSSMHMSKGYRFHFDQVNKKTPKKNKQSSSFAKILSNISDSDSDCSEIQTVISPLCYLPTQKSNFTRNQRICNGPIVLSNKEKSSTQILSRPQIFNDFSSSSYQNGKDQLIPKLEQSDFIEETRSFINSDKSQETKININNFSLNSSLAEVDDIDFNYTHSLNIKTSHSEPCKCYISKSNSNPQLSDWDVQWEDTSFLSQENDGFTF